MKKFLLLAWVCINVIAAPLWLHCCGTQITNSRGEKVYLRGVNFGAWLLNEMWMTDFQPRCSNLTCEIDIERILKKRFGNRKAAELLNIFQNSYINEQDFKIVKKLKFNCIRLPIFYSLLEENKKFGNYKTSGWKKLDFAISNCTAENIYCIIDLHGAPGGQSADHTTGQTGLDKLYWDKKFQDQTVLLWKEIAKRYKNNPTVAGYDLLNEPYGAPTKKSLVDLYNKIYNAIREIDKKHIIFIEDRGPWHGGLNELPLPQKMDWENVIYETHLYDFKNYGLAAHKKLIENFAKEKISKKYNVPVLIGEFHPWGDSNVWKFYLQQFQSNKWHWTLWTYKCSAKAGDWGIIRTDVSPDILKDSYSELSNKFTRYNTKFSTCEEWQFKLFDLP